MAPWWNMFMLWTRLLRYNEALYKAQQIKNNPGTQITKAKQKISPPICVTKAKGHIQMV